jgi:glutamyl-tRNA reductase
MIPLPEMDLFLFGLNHVTAPVEVRERWAFSSRDSHRALEALSGELPLSEHLILSTCNRTEFYGYVQRSRSPLSPSADPAAQRSALARFYRGFHQLQGTAADHNPEHFYIHRQQAAVEHLFRLAGGLDSMIVGEAEILRQIKDAFTVARSARAAGRMFQRLFPEALRVGKRVRTQTAISKGCITPGQAALKLAREVLGDLRRASVLLIGSGKIATLTARAFEAEGILRFTVANRTRERAEELAQKLRVGCDAPPAGSPIDWEQLGEALVDASLVISSTGATTPLVRRPLLEEVQARRGHRPLVVIDLAIPRDFHPEVAEIPGVRLFNIDDLNRVVQDNVARRHQHVPLAEEIVRRHLNAFYGKMTYLEVDPVIRHLLKRFEEIRQGELQAAIDSFPPEHHAALEQMTSSLVKKLLHFPIERLKSLRDLGGLSDTEVAFLKRLFLAER